MEIKRISAKGILKKLSIWIEKTVDKYIKGVIY